MSLSARKSARLKATLLAASSMTVMSGAIISPALPQIDRYFAEQPDLWVKLILTMPALMIAVFGAVMGDLSDRFGRKHLLLAALLLYGLAGAAGFWIDSLWLLLASRAVLGVAVAGIMSVSTTLMGDYFEGEERARLMGLQGGVMAMGGVLFFSVGGVLAEWSWRGPFLVYLTGLMLSPFAALVLHEPERHLPNARNSAPASQIDLSRTGFVYALSLLCMLLFYMIPVQLPFLLEQQSGAGGLARGLAIAVCPVTAAMASFGYRRISALGSFVTVYVLSLTLVAAGFLVIGAAEHYAVIMAGVALSGLGFGLFMPNGSLWLMSITPSRARGRVIGGFSSTLYLGQFVSPLAAAPIVTAFRLEGAFVAVATLSAAVALALWALSRARKAAIR
jgi:MFS family permease